MKKIRQAVLVDNNETTNFYNEDVLEESGSFDEIIVLSGGVEAINFFKDLDSVGKPFPELMFLDIRMPDCEGFEVLEQLEELFEGRIDEMKVCMLTTSNHKRDVENFENFVTAVEYLNKPLVSEVLENVVAKYF